MNIVLRTKQPRDWWNTVALGALALIVFLMFWVSACSSTSSRATNIPKAQPTGTQLTTPPGSASVSQPAEKSVPTSLSNAGEYGENVYDFAKANDWKKADIKAAALRGAVKKVHADVNNKSAEIAILDRNVTDLEHAVTTRDRQAAMREANQVTLDVANMTTAYKLSVPVEVTRLDYFGRELEVWAQAKDADKLQATAREMRRTWDSLRPAIAAHSAAETKKFDALVAQIESAKTPADYARVATLELNEVDNLEKLFP
jgi:hypothetical protein